MITSTDKATNWFEHDMGHQLLIQEAALFPSLVPPKYYQQAAGLQSTQVDVCEQLNVGNLIQIGAGLDEGCDVVAVPEHLPFPESSIDLMFLLHTLDYCENPVTALREASQVLNAEGILVLTGFNPYSLCGISQKLSLRKSAPYTARFTPVKVVQDWLALLGFTLLCASMLEYRPLTKSEDLRSKLDFLNKLGDRWWPGAGGVYVLVAKKQIYSKINVKRRSSHGRDWLKILNPIPADSNKK